MKTNYTGPPPVFLSYTKRDNKKLLNGILKFSKVSFLSPFLYNFKKNLPHIFLRLGIYFLVPKVCTLKNKPTQLSPKTPVLENIFSTFGPAIWIYELIQMLRKIRFFKVFMKKA